jgi:hypothetical protein
MRRTNSLHCFNFLTKRAVDLAFTHRSAKRSMTCCGLALCFTRVLPEKSCLYGAIGRRPADPASKQKPIAQRHRRTQAQAVDASTRIMGLTRATIGRRAPGTVYFFAIPIARHVVRVFLLNYKKPQAAQKTSTRKNRCAFPALCLLFTCSFTCSFPVP